MVSPDNLINSLYQNSYRMLTKKTKNIYSGPIDAGYIKKIVTKVPTHKKYVSKETGATYDLAHAVDFICDEGTKVRASFDGEVVYVVDDMKKNYNHWQNSPLKEEEEDGNRVVLKHPNGEFSIYSHIRYKQVLVRKGQMVKEGEILGYSGNTGLSIKPHLHFMVFIFPSKNKKDIQSLKIRWKEN